MKNNTAVGNYYPIKIGNTWTLETPDRRKQRTYTLAAANTPNSQALTELKIITHSGGGSVLNTQQYFVSATAEEIKLHKAILQDVKAGSVTVPFSPGATFFRFPLTLGDKWNIQGSANVKMFLTAKIVTNVGVVGCEQVVTPAGTFDDCFKVELKTHISALFVDMRQTAYQWLAPDVGPVKYQEGDSSVYALVNSNLLKATD